MHSFQDNNNKSIPKIEECVNLTHALSSIKISAKKKEEREKEREGTPVSRRHFHRREKSGTRKRWILERGGTERTRGKKTRGSEYNRGTLRPAECNIRARARRAWVLRIAIQIAGRGEAI